MTDTVIHVSRLAKRYRIGRQERYRTTRQALAERLQRLTRRRHAEDDAAGGPGGIGGGDPAIIWPLSDVSFSVRRGQVLGLIGRNGAGKSTLLKILSRITKPTAGSVSMKGRVGSLLEVGTGFHAELTGRENVYLNGAILGMRRSEVARRFDEILEFAEIGPFIDTPVKRYSSGMYLKLAFAVAAHFDPEILLVDEVLAVGDVAFQRKCLGKMHDVARAGRTVILVSHNLTAIQSLCTSCLFLARGKLLMHDTPERCVRAYIDMNAPEIPSATRTFTRPDACPLWMKRVTVFADGEPTASPDMGADLAIEIEFESDTAIQHPRFGLTITTADGFPVFNISSRYQPSPPLSPPSRSGTIRLQLGKIPFVGRRYYLSLFMGNQLEDTHVEENALWLDIREKDLHGAGKVPPGTDSALWWPAQFSTAST